MSTSKILTAVITAAALALPATAAFAGKPNMGRATALAFILALFIMGVTYLAKRFSKEESLY